MQLSALLKGGESKSTSAAAQPSTGFLKDIMPCQQLGAGEGRYFLLGASYRLFALIVFGLVALIMAIYILIAIGKIGQQMTQRGTAILAFCMSLVLMVLAGLAGYRAGGNVMRMRLNNVFKYARSKLDGDSLAKFDSIWSQGVTSEELCKRKNVA